MNKMNSKFDSIIENEVQKFLSDSSELRDDEDDDDKDEFEADDESETDSESDSDDEEVSSVTISFYNYSKKKKIKTVLSAVKRKQTAARVKIIQKQQSFSLKFVLDGSGNKKEEFSMSATLMVRNDT